MCGVGLRGFPRPKFRNDLGIVGPYPSGPQIFVSVAQNSGSYFHLNVYVWYGSSIPCPYQGIRVTQVFSTLLLNFFRIAVACILIMEDQTVSPRLEHSNAQETSSSLVKTGRTMTPQFARSLESLQQGSIAWDRSSLPSRPGSIGGQSTQSSQSVLLDDIKHEIMINHIYQQQCSHLWVSDGSGEYEGVLLRKSRANYLACPQSLLNSNLARMCAQLNVQVSKPSRSSRWKLNSRRWPSQ